MPTIAHTSDLHLQSGVPTRQTQVEPIFQKINEMKPDLVVISGDVTDDGWDSIEELKWAKGWLEERIEGDWFAVPGNHDVGNFVDLPDGKVTDKRAENWIDLFGSQHEASFDRWIIIGLNSMLIGSELSAREAENTWLMWGEKRFMTKHVASFLHSPLWINKIDEPHNADANYWLGSEQGRLATWTQLDYCNNKLICSGHVHQTRLTEIDGVKIAWAPPASGTWVHAPGLPNPPMPKQTGFFLHTLHDDGRVESELIECAPMLKLYEHRPER
ncbi:MAG: metallophosphoesterase family protein [Phycisphaeraceae bacterium]